LKTHSHHISLLLGRGRSPGQGRPAESFKVNPLPSPILPSITERGRPGDQRVESHIDRAPARLYQDPPFSSRPKGPSFPGFPCSANSGICSKSVGLELENSGWPFPPLPRSEAANQQTSGTGTRRAYLGRPRQGVGDPRTGPPADRHVTRGPMGRNVPPRSGKSRHFLASIRRRNGVAGIRRVQGAQTKLGSELSSRRIRRYFDQADSKPRFHREAQIDANKALGWRAMAAVQKGAKDRPTYHNFPGRNFARAPSGLNVVGYGSGARKAGGVPPPFAPRNQLSSFREF